MRLAAAEISKRGVSDYEQENVPAEQPSSRQGARFPPAYAHPCRPRHPGCTPSQGPHRTLRVASRPRQPVVFVLAKAQRITSADDYKRVVRRGRRIAGVNCVTYQLMNPNGGAPRFGFIVAKTVGNAVVRNRVRRRLKAIAFDLARTLPDGAETVFRALPPAATANFSDLSTEAQRSTERLVAKS